MTGAKREHILFHDFPLQAKVKISTGVVPAPYHIYDGYGYFVGGSADFHAVRQLLTGQQVRPVQDTHVRALMGIWVCDFTEASLGPHHELQISFFVAPQPVADIPAHPLSIAHLMLTRLDVAMLCFGLWNNTETVVAYNRERLGLDARLAQSTIVRDNTGGSMRFEVHDGATSCPVMNGSLRLQRRNQMHATWSLMRLVGLKTMLANLSAPYTPMRVVNPVTPMFPQNNVAMAYAKSQTNLLRYYDPATDNLRFGGAPFDQLDFRPTYVQQMGGFRFVYLDPSAAPTAPAQSSAPV